MTGPDDLRDRLGGDVPPDEMERLREVDALLRSVPAPPPRGSARPVAPPRRRPVRLAALAVAAVLVVATAFAAGALLRSGGGFDAEATVALAPAAAVPAGASGEVRLGAPDDHGNRAIELDVRGLPEGRAVYALGVARPGGGMWRCGTFATGTGAATVRMTVPYPISEDATWVVSRAGTGGDSPEALLRGAEAG
ncbi:MAG TPA: hypothetical protein VFG74_00460 [Miltoncostaeaceae bacterium]|nr:hypothetical protein [Miltoncostaeaceae bacterium]